MEIEFKMRNQAAELRSVHIVPAMLASREKHLISIDFSEQ